MDKDTMPARLKAQLKDEAIQAFAQDRGITEEEAIFNLMKNQPTMYGAMSDWDDIRNISIAVIRELRPYRSCREVYEFVMNVVTLYDTRVISVLRVFSDVRRLAIFVHEMIESLLEIPQYRRGIIDQYQADANDQILLRGIVLKRITREPVQTLFEEDRNRFFRAEAFRASELIKAHTQACSAGI